MSTKNYRNVWFDISCYAVVLRPNNFTEPGSVKFS